MIRSEFSDHTLHFAIIGNGPIHHIVEHIGNRCSEFKIRCFLYLFPKNLVLAHTIRLGCKNMNSILTAELWPLLSRWDSLLDNGTGENSSSSAYFNTVIKRLDFLVY